MKKVKSILCVLLAVLLICSFVTKEGVSVSVSQDVSNSLRELDVPPDASVSSVLGGSGSGWINDRTVANDPSCADCRPSIATDSNGYLYVAYEVYFTYYGRWGISISKSTDGGASWSYFASWCYPTNDIHYPSMAIDPYDNSIYVAFELDSGDHDIYCRVYHPSTGWQLADVVDGDTEDDRFPSITSEYQFGALNYQYISYECWVTANDIDLMRARSWDHGASWSLQTVFGGSDTDVHHKTCITNAEGRVFIAYKHAADQGSSPTDINVAVSSDSGTTWTEYTDVDGTSTKTCDRPSIAATHGTHRVIVAFEYWYGITDSDIFYSYSTNNGASWTKGFWLTESTDAEISPHLAVDGQGSTSSLVYGWVHLVYAHAVAGTGYNFEYRSTSYDHLDPEYWTTAQTVNDVRSFITWTAFSLGITTQYRSADSKYYPCVAWSEDRGVSEAVYYSTPGATYTIATSPSGLQVQVDGTSYSAPHGFNWVAGYSHTIYAPSPQGSYVYDHWDDGGAQSHSVTVGTSATTITAVFTYAPVQYTITFYTDPTSVGSITFSGVMKTNGQTGQYAAGDYAISPNVPSGYGFGSWVTTGGITVSGSTAHVTGAGTVKAVFTGTLITYDAGTNTVTVIGGTAGSPLGFLDVWNADQAGGWGVVSKTGTTQFAFDAKLYIGSAGTATYFADKDKIVVFNTGIATASYQSIFYGAVDSTITLGQLEDAAAKSTSHGCVIQMLEASYYNSQFWGAGTLYLYSCTLMGYWNGAILGQPILYGLTATSKVYNCLFVCFTLQTALPGSEVNNLVVTGGKYAVTACRGTMNDIRCYTQDYALYVTTNYPATISNVILRDATIATTYVNAITTDKYLINVDSDAWTFQYAGTSTAKIYRQYTFDLKVTDSAGNPVNGATVTLKDKNSGTVFSVTTDSNGNIPIQTVSRGWYSQTYLNTLQDYSPHTLTISKTGYTTYTQKFTLTGKTSWQIALSP
jgi:hypothetical protein